MIWTGYKRPLTTKDMWSLRTDNLSHVITKKFDRKWIPSVEKAKDIALKKSLETSEKSVPQMGILLPLWKTFWPGIIFLSFLKLIASVLTFVNPIVLDLLITYMTPENNQPQWRGYFYAALMLISPMIESILNSQYDFGINTISMRVRACLISTIYKKVTFYYTINIYIYIFMYIRKV